MPKIREKSRPGCGDFSVTFLLFHELQRPPGKKYTASAVSAVPPTDATVAIITVASVPDPDDATPFAVRIEFDVAVGTPVNVEISLKFGTSAYHRNLWFDRVLESVPMVQL